MINAILLSLCASIAATLYFIEFTRLYLKIKLFGLHPFNRKPFNCEACLPFWLFAAFLPFAIYSWIPVAIIAAACSAGIITPLIIKAIRK